MGKRKFWSEKNKISLMIFLAVFFFGLVWAAIVPTREAPDEEQHIAMVNFFLNQRRIPIFDQEESLSKITFVPQLWTEKFRTGAYYSQAYNSPLPYLPFLFFSPDQSHPDVKSPARIVCSLFIALFAALLFLSLRNLEPKKTSAAALTSVFIALIPQVIFSAGYVNIEPVALFFSALAFYFLTLILVSKNRPTVFLFFGLTLGFLALCKANYLALVLFFILVAGRKIFLAKDDRKSKFYNIVATAVPILTLNAWWWTRNIKFYRDPIIVSYISRKVADSGPEWFLPPVRAGYNLISIIFQPDFAKNIFFGFFAALGRLDIFLPLVFYILFFLIIVLLFVSALTEKKNRLIVTVVLLLFIINLLVFANKNLVDFSPQGRHLFPMLLPLTWILYLGVAKIKSLIAKLGIFFFSLLAATWSLAAVYFRYKTQGASLHENTGVFSIPLLMVYTIIIVAVFVLLIIKIYRIRNDE